MEGLHRSSLKSNEPCPKTENVVLLLGRFTELVKLQNWFFPQKKSKNDEGTGCSLLLEKSFLRILNSNFPTFPGFVTHAWAEENGVTRSRLCGIQKKIEEVKHGKT